MAWKSERDLLCPGCGQSRDESMADEDHAPHYEAEALQCHSCRATHLAASDMAGRDAPDPTAGVYFAVHQNGQS